MNLSDDIIIIDSNNSSNDTPIQDEDGGASLRELESQGVSVVINENISISSSQSHENFSKQLMEEEGIEIIPSGDED